MRFDRDAGIAVKCDLCLGAPKCAEFCPNRALEMR
jgi:Fe-S-cluster-containing hydrogenase component 2